MDITGDLREESYGDVKSIVFAAGGVMGASDFQSPYEY